MSLLAFVAQRLGADPLNRIDENRPLRPSLPLPLVLGLSLCLGCAFSWSVGLGLPDETCALLASSALALCIVFTTLGFARRRFLAACLAAGLLIGSSLAFAESAQLHRQMVDFGNMKRFEGTVTLLEDASSGGFGSHAFVSVRTPIGDVLKVQAYFPDGERLAMYGETFHATIDLSEPSGSSANWLWQQGAAGTADLSDVEPEPQKGVRGTLLHLRASSVAAFAGDDEVSAVLQALVCGYCANYDQTNIQGAFTTCGLAHIVAVSGAHLAIVSAFVASLLRALRCPRAMSTAVQLVLMGFYLVLTGMPLSAVRAFVMVTVVQLSYLAQRRSAGLAALGVCVGVMTAFDPTVAVSASFTLSALSTLGIALFGPLASVWVRGLIPRMPHVLGDALALTFASSTLAQLYSCALFSQLPIVSPLANVVVAPLVAPVCTVGILGAVLMVAIPFAAQPLLGFATAGASVLCTAVNACAAIPYASVPVWIPIGPALALTASVAIALWYFWPLPLGRVRLSRVAAAGISLVLAGTCVFLVSSALRGNQLVMLDVGQGDAFLVRSGTAAVLIDTGTNDLMLRKAIARQGIIHLDAVFITHSDDDHCGSLAALASCVAIDRIVVASGALSCSCDSCVELLHEAEAIVGASSVMGASAGDEFQIGEIFLEAIWPYSYEEEGGNADSLCLLLRYAQSAEEIRALLTGDAESEQIDEIRKNIQLSDIDIFKVGHHGSKNALTKEQAKDLSPKISLVSVGEGNRYGHPDEGVIAALESSGSQIFRTDRQGDVECSFTPRGLRVSTLR